jgi:hypothetical protein
METKITKLSIFDFDGTLIDTPLPEFGKKHYEEKTGIAWPYRGWWGRELTLDMDIFEMPVVPQVIDAYNKEVTNDSACVVMLTGRMEIMRPHVIKILDSHDLKFDEYHFNKFGATEVAKVRTMTKLLEKYPDVAQIELWDDRVEHIPIFEAFFLKLVEEGRLISYNINLVPADRH